MSEIIEITTASLRNVPFYRISNYVLRVDIKGSSDAMIILVKQNPRLNLTQRVDSFHIGIGQEETWIRHGREAMMNPRGDIISPNEYKTFCLSWMGRKICFGEPYQEPIVVYDLNDDRQFDECPFQYVGFGCMNERSIIHWRFEVPLSIPRTINPVNAGSLVWVKPLVKQTNKQTSIPGDAILGGVENGEPLYLIRAKYNGSITPGKFRADGVASLSWGGRELSTKEYEFLCGYDFIWVPTSLDIIPTTAFQGGKSEVRNEPLYIGRAIHEGQLITGKVQRSHSVCYIPFNGSEIAKRKYEILCLPHEIEHLPVVIVPLCDNGLTPDLF